MNRSFLPAFSGEFPKYVAATILTSVGTGMHTVAMAWFLYKYTGTVLAVGWFLVLSTLPGLVLTPWTGVLVDRWNDRWTCIVSDVLRGFVLLCLPVAIHFDAWVVGTIWITTFLVAVVNIFFQPARDALIRDISSADNLLNANIMGNMSVQVGMLTGASIGGILLARFGVALVVLLNIASFFVSAALTLWIKHGRITGKSSATRERKTFLRELRDTLAYVGENRFIVWLAIVQMFGSVTVYLCNTLLPAFVDKELAAGPRAFGLIDAAWGAGAIAGGFALAYIGRHLKNLRIISTFGPLVLSCSVLLFLTSQSVLQALLGFFAMGLIVCGVRVSTETEIAAAVDYGYFGKIKSVITMFISYISLGVYGIVGYLGDRVSARWIFLALCVTVFVCFIFKLIKENFVRRRFARLSSP